MNAEIICVGTELLLGDVLNTNSAFISKELSKYGINCFYHTTVGDNRSRIKQVIDYALKRSSLIIFTGGLGPTPDDITIESIADYFKVNLVEHKKAKDDIINYFVNLGRDMPESNLKQSLLPDGADCISNITGTAPGMLWHLKQKDYPQLNSDKHIIALPGVPSEVYRIWDDSVSIFLNELSNNIIVSKKLKFAGISEALLAEKLVDIMQQDNPTVAPYVSKGQPYLRIAAKSEDESTAFSLIEKTKNQILLQVGKFCYGFDNEGLEHAISKILLSNNKTVATAESCTGGLISSRLTDVPGSSSYICLNLVTYSNQAKIEMLGVCENTISNHGAVSEQTAKEMAEGVRKKAGTDFGISITGIAGPTGATPNKPVGLAYVGVSGFNTTKAYKIIFTQDIDRLEMKLRFAQRALYCLWDFLRVELVAG